MRFTPLIGGLTLSCLLAGPLAAQSLPYTATVVTDTDVRCLPGTGASSYLTNRLKARDTVTVVQERSDGWLAIEPPKGSFSYINAKYVQANYYNWMVVADPREKVPVFVGSNVINERPTVIAKYLDRGAQVRSRWNAIQDSEGMWLPIEPPAGEVRYVKADALRRVTALQDTPVAAATAPLPATPTRPTNEVQVQLASRFIPENVPPSPAPVSSPPVIPAPPPPSSPTPVPTAPAPQPAPSSLWARAQQAERAGRIVEAVELYNQIYRENYASNPQDADWALKRAAFLRSGQFISSSQPTTTTSLPAASATTTTSVPAPQVKYMPLQTQQDPPPVTATNPGGFGNPSPATPSVKQTSAVVKPEPKPPSATLNPPALDAGSTGTSSSHSITPGLPANVQLYRSGPGTLVRASRQIDGLPTYRFITTPVNPALPNPTLYVTEAPGINLGQFENQTVELTGAAEYRGVERANHMRVYQVQPLTTNP